MEMKDELAISLQMTDQYSYDNNFIYYQPVQRQRSSGYERKKKAPADRLPIEVSVMGYVTV
ncbi:hypothetical protein ACHAW5_010029 [Stephanodiscus triporus]|uniref:Uncharacterized protein n=1 Tax=Stephanodiscus triporus TaxID=2934178 RepID=A0ABD3N1D7_9STRA